MSKLSFSLIVAMDENQGIGVNGQLPWNLPPDLKHFKKVTTTEYVPGGENIVMMGRKTWDSLPPQFRPLPQRVNVVISRQNLQLPSGVILASGLDDALQKIARRSHLGELFVIGGEQIFTAAINHPNCKKLYITKLHQSFKCDTFFPAIPIRFKVLTSNPVEEFNGIKYQFVEYSALI